MAEPDIWSRWLLERRSGGDPELRRRMLESLRPVRDRVIANAMVPAGGRVLDVGCGDGMIGFGVLEKHPDATVTFSDISAPLLEVCEAIATEAGLRGRCEFLLADATDLKAIPDASVDAVTLRSVLIYVPDKAAAHREFFRVLRPGGRLSYFEPINAVARGSSQHPDFFGYPIDGAEHLVAKVMAVFEAIQGSNDPMLNFTERDLVDFAAAASFQSVTLDMRIRANSRMPAEYRLTWEQWLQQSGNPKIPSIAEAIDQALDDGEKAEFEVQMRPRVEAGRGLFRMGTVYLTAVR